MRLAICLFALALVWGCAAPPGISGPPGPVPAAPRLLPWEALQAPAVGVDPGPGVAARGAGLRLWAQQDGAR